MYTHYAHSKKGNAKFRLKADLSIFCKIIWSKLIDKVVFDGQLISIQINWNFPYLQIFGVKGGVRESFYNQLVFSLYKVIQIKSHQSFIIKM